MKRPFAAAGFSLLLFLALIMLTSLSVIYAAVIILIIITDILIIKKVSFYNYFLMLTACAVIASLTFTYCDKFIYKTALSYTGQNCEISGTTADYPENTENSSLITLNNCVIDGRQTKCKINLYTSPDFYCAPSDTLTFTADEIFELNSDGKFFYHSLSKNVFLGAFAQKNIEIQKSSDDGIYLRLLKMRHDIKEKILIKLDGKSAPAVIALLLGDTGYLEENTTDTFRLSGTAHMFAVSGMHLSLWSGLIFILFKRRMRVRVIPNIAAIIFILFYVVLTGFSPSVIRAAIMLITVFSGAIIKKKADTLNSLGLAVFAILIYNPYMAGNISFLLSVTATLGITTLYPLLGELSEKPDRRTPAVRKFSLKIKDAVLLSVTALLFTMPLSAIFFGVTSLWAPLTNLICAPVCEGAMLFSAAGIIFSGIPVLSPMIFGAAQCFTSLLMKTAGYFSSLSFGICSLDRPYILPLLIGSAVCVTAVYFLSKRSAAKTFTALLVCAALSLGTGIADNIITRNDINMYIPQCANGVSVCVSSPVSGKAILIGC